MIALARFLHDGDKSEHRNKIKTNECGVNKVRASNKTVDFNTMKVKGHGNKKSKQKKRN